MAQAARRRVDPFVAARSALDAGRNADGAAQIREIVAGDPSGATYDHAINLAIEFNLVTLARELAAAGAKRYPRDAKLRRWAHVLAPPVAREYAGPPLPKRDWQKDIAWLRAHADAYRGQWVVLDDGRLLAAGKRLKATLRRARGRSEHPMAHYVRE